MTAASSLCFSQHQHRRSHSLHVALRRRSLAHCLAVVRRGAEVITLTEHCHQSTTTTTPHQTITSTDSSRSLAYLCNKQLRSIFTRYETRPGCSHQCTLRHDLTHKPERTTPVTTRRLPASEAKPAVSRFTVPTTCTCIVKSASHFLQNRLTFMNMSWR